MHENTDNLIQIELKPRDPRALNAYRHGLTGQVLIMTPEDQAAYHQHCQNIKKALAPEGAFEAGLAQSIADDRWRLFRAASLDINTCAVSISEPDKITTEHPQIQTAFAQAVAWAADSKNMNLLSLYEGRIQRRVEKRNLKMLKESPGGAQSRPRSKPSKRPPSSPKPARMQRGETYERRAHEFPPSALPPQF